MLVETAELLENSPRLENRLHSLRLVASTSILIVYDYHLVVHVAFADAINTLLITVLLIVFHSFHNCQKELLNGQKLQGTLTSKEVHTILSRHNLTSRFPLFTLVHDIAYASVHPSRIVDALTPIAKL
jgi:hypothetical protein